MIISNRWFRLSIGRRSDLSCRPFGVLLILWPRDATRVPNDPQPLYYKLVSGKSFGFHLPSQIWDCELIIFKDKPSPDDWRQWPESDRLACESATARYLNETAKERGCGQLRIVHDISRCERRVDLSGGAWQLYRGIRVAS